MSLIFGELEACSIIWKIADLTSKDETQEVLRECSVIFHLAGMKHCTTNSHDLNELITITL